MERGGVQFDLVAYPTLYRILVALTAAIGVELRPEPRLRSEGAIEDHLPPVEAGPLILGQAGHRVAWLHRFLARGDCDAEQDCPRGPSPADHWIGSCLEFDGSTFST